jgi:hypothetical protein
LGRDKIANSTLFWFLIIAGLLMGIVSLLGWPFRTIARRLPGRREKLLQGAIEERRADIEASRQLLSVLAPGNRKAAARLEKSIEKAESEIAGIAREKGWPEDFVGRGPGALLVEILQEIGIVSGIDWRGSEEDLATSLTPLLQRRGVALDWKFVQEILAVGGGEALRNSVLLPVVGDRVAKLGYVLAHVVDGSDSYQFAVCTPEEFLRIDGLTCRSFTIRGISSAAGPVAEP